MRLKAVFISLLIYALFSMSCHKNEDSIKPLIDVIAPAEGVSYTIFDTIYVQAKISDETALTHVSVELVNSDFISVVSPYGRNISGTSYNLFASLIIDNIQLQSGTYYILITAKDNENTTRSYTKVNLNGIAYESIAYVSFENMSDQFEVHAYAGGNDSLLYQGSGILKGGVVDSYNQQFGMLVAPEGPFLAFPLYPFIDAWDIPIKQGGLTFCRAQADKNTIQIGFKNQLLSFYTGEDQLRGNYLSDDNYYPNYSLDLDEEIVVWQLTPSSSSEENRIESYFKSGALKQVSSYDRSVVQMLPKNDDYVYIISNDGSTAYMDVYGLENGVITISEAFPNTHFNDACIGQNGHLYLASDEAIIKYNPFNFQFSDFAMQGAKHLEYDVTQGLYLAVNNNQLKLLNGSGSQVQAYALHGECIALSIWYSK